MPVTRAPQTSAKIEGEPAPAGADVEHMASRLEQQLRRKVPLLGKLGLFNGLVGRLEISPTELLIGVEEERIERSIEVILVGDSCSGSGGSSGSAWGC